MSSLYDLPIEVQHAIRDILDKEADPYPDDLVSTLNTLFPDEASLESIEEQQLRLRRQVQSTRDEIDTLKRDMAEASGQQDKMAKLQELIGDLFTQINELRSGATESEVVVREITRDIKALDFAKKNIVASMTSVKRFQMLVNGYEQLTRLAKSKRYREAAQALQATRELSAHFKSYTAVDRISALFRGISQIQGTLREQVMLEFRTALTSDTKIGRSQTLPDACLVVDALGPDAKQSLLEYYTTLQLSEYRRIFKPEDEAGQLDNLSRRYSWFRRCLKTFEEEHAAVFPKEWKVGCVLCGAFSAVTRDDLKTVLSKTAQTLAVGLLLESLQLTTEFQKEMSTRLNMPFEQIAAMAVQAVSGTPSIITTVFEPYLSIFVDAQDRALAEMMSSYRKPLPFPPGAQEDREESRILPSSTELFYFYRETLDRCAQLSNKSPFLDLCGVYKKWLKVYAEEVLGSSLKTGVIKDTRRSSGDKRLNVADVVNACSVINTADYCAETAGQLEEKLKEKIHADLTDRVSLESEKELFLGIISIAITTLLRELELSLEPAFQTMLRCPWRDAEYVSAESTYVADLHNAMTQVVDIIKSKLEQKKYIRSFCDRVVSLVTGKFTQCIVRCRPISMTGAEQILLDLHAVQRGLLKLPQSNEESAGANASYARYVSKHTAKIDTLLQGILTPDNPAEEFVKNYLILIPCQSFSDFQKMLDLKGVRRTDQNALLDVFLTKTSTMRDLSDSSFLSTIDMDSNTSASLAVPSSPNQSTSNSIFSIGSGALSFAMQATGSRDHSSTGSRMGSPKPSGRTASFDGSRNMLGIGDSPQQKFDLRKMLRFGSSMGQPRD